MRSSIERFVPSSPGPDCPMTVDAERLIGATVQVKLLVWEIVVLLNVVFCANKGKGREGVKKKSGKVWSFATPGGRGGSPRVMKKPYCFFGKVFFSENVESF